MTSKSNGITVRNVLAAFLGSEQAVDRAWEALRPRLLELQKALPAIMERVETVQAAEAEARRLLEAVKTESLHEFASRPPVSALTLLSALALDDEEAAARARQEVARSGGEASHAKERRAQIFVQREWKQYGADVYGSNKAEFTRLYARRVENEFGVTVTERTMRERWLPKKRVSNQRTRS